MLGPRLLRSLFPVLDTAFPWLAEECGGPVTRHTPLLQCTIATKHFRFLGTSSLPLHVSETRIFLKFQTCRPYSHRRKFYFLKREKKRFYFTLAYNTQVLWRPFLLSLKYLCYYAIITKWRTSLHQHCNLYRRYSEP